MVKSVNCDVFVYEDESTLLVSGKNPIDIENTLHIWYKWDIWFQ